MLKAVLTVLGSYLAGGVPISYLAGRLLRGVDIREHGTGNVGASNVWRSVSKAAVAPVGVAEIGQGALGPAVAKATGQGRGVQVLSGLASLAGHNWSPYLGLTGGRGVGHAIGFMLVLSRPALAAFIGLSLIGVALRKIPQLVGLGIAVAPLAALAKREPREAVAGMAGMASLIMAKRLLANQPGLPSGTGARRVLLNRLVYDRDTREREPWVRDGEE